VLSARPIIPCRPFARLFGPFGDLLTDHDRDADDEFDMTDTLSMLFALNGFAVHCASNGKEALDTVGKSSPDLIISDCMMPIMDGLEFCGRVRGDAATQGIPIILMSASPSRHDLSSVAFDIFMKKPFPFDSLLVEVRKLLEPS